jgi:hypothetical protein
MEHRTSQFDVSEVSRTFRHAFTASLTFEVAVYCSHSRIHQSSNFWTVCCLIHNLRVLHFGHRVRFLRYVSVTEQKKSKENIQSLREKECRTELRVLCGWVPRNKQIDDLAWLQKTRRANKEEPGVEGYEQGRLKENRWRYSILRHDSGGATGCRA